MLKLNLIIKIFKVDNDFYIIVAGLKYSESFNNYAYLIGIPYLNQNF